MLLHGGYVHYGVRQEAYYLSHASEVVSAKVPPMKETQKRAEKEAAVIDESSVAP